MVRVQVACPPTTTTMSDSLSIARINRLLRQLNARCASLAALRAQCTVQSLTYSTKPSNPSASLAILRLPENCNWRQSRQETSQSLQLTKSIYAVRQAYTNIVQAAFDKDEQRSVCPTLASICAHIAGRAVSEAKDDEEDEQETLGYVSELFESVPAHHRRSVLARPIVCLLIRP